MARRGVGRGMRAIALMLIGLVASAASAQDAGLDPEASALRHAIDSDPWTGTGSEEATDPLARADTATLASVIDDPDVDVVEAPIPIRHGEILEAISGVSLRSHAITVTLELGLAVVTETMVLASVARHRAEAMLTLAVPDGAALVSLHVENAGGARDGVVTDTAAQSAYDDALYVRSTTPSSRPVAHARLSDQDGHALIVRAAPVGTGSPSDTDAGALSVSVTWVVPTPMHGGVVRFSMPARGADARDASPELSVSAVDVVEPRVDGVGYERGPIDLRNASGFVVTARAPISRGPHVDAAIVPCGAARCVVLAASGGRARMSSAPITIAIDASPSTSIGARGRITDVVRVVSALLPASTPVRWIAFASRTEDLGHGAPADVDLARVRSATDAHLGSATRFSALWSMLRDTARAGDRILVIGDGGLTSGVLETAALDEARARGMVLSAIDVANRAPMQALSTVALASGGVVVEAGPAADRSATRHGDDALTELVSVALAESIARITAHVDARVIPLGTLRTGESALYVGPGTRADLAMGDARATAHPPDAAHAAILAALASHQAAMIAVDPADLDASAGACAANGSARARPASRASSIVGHGLRVAPAHRRSCLPTIVSPPLASPVAQLPARALRDQLRRRVIPPARRCFRDDRAGRTALHREAVFQIVLADREIVDASVEGDLPDALRTCLLLAFDGVDVPSFDGTLAVRWPVHTDAIAPPPVIELAPDVARDVRAIAGDEPIPTAPSP